jgi:N5-(carboxyethyl)ornithine synthase
MNLRFADKGDMRVTGKEAFMLALGVIGSSRKEHEQRLPLHPDHFDFVPESARKSMRFETGYGMPFDVSDDQLRRRFGGVAERASLLAGSDIVLLPKPQAEDLREMRCGGTLWGWAHCVQQADITQMAIDRKLTLLAWEAMFSWNNGARGMHVFSRNNEMAGYCGVIHALGLTGMDGHYGRPAAARVISHGSVSRGAIYALIGRGFGDIRVYTLRPPWAVQDKIIGCRYAQIVDIDATNPLTAVEEDGVRRPLADALAEADVIVNGTLQNTDRPLLFLHAGEEKRLAPGALIVDVSCDLAMGFPFARPTSFERPTFAVGSVTYYGVDHTPTYLWRSASWELSRVVVAFIEAVMNGPEAWNKCETLGRAIEIREGVIQNDKITRFQKRTAEYPHHVCA